MLPSLVLDDTLAKIFVKGVQDAFHQLFGVTPAVGAHSVQKDFVNKGDISGILGMIQEKVEATMVLSFQKNTICFAMERLYGQPFTELNHSVKQGVGELTNIIYAGVKKDLNGLGYKFKMSIPTVIIGANHAVYNIHTGQTLVIPFTLDSGKFFVEITLQQS